MVLNVGKVGHAMRMITFSRPPIRVGEMSIKAYCTSESPLQ